MSWNRKLTSRTETGRRRARWYEDFFFGTWTKFSNPLRREVGSLQYILDFMAQRS
jgi:hypothetical protein